MSKYGFFLNEKLMYVALDKQNTYFNISCLSPSYMSYIRAISNFFLWLGMELLENKEICELLKHTT
jgi:hypothetical protein